MDTSHWLPADKPQNYAIWSGRIIPDKGVHLAIQAAQLAGVQLKICGPIHDAGYFSRHVRPLLNRQTTYLGSLSTQALAEQVAQASVFLCTPCWDEPFGLVAAEALSSGTPIAGFSRGALTEIVTPETGILVPETVDALAQAIGQAQQLSRANCRRRAIERFSMTRMIQNYIQLYQTVVSDHSRLKPLALPLVS
ncbi:MAG: glycosyltransferase [Elainellaceae cyanobacterium]